MRYSLRFVFLVIVSTVLAIIIKINESLIVHEKGVIQVAVVKIARVYEFFVHCEFYMKMIKIFP